MIWFTYLEQTVTAQFHPVHITLDDYIPFNEWFIIPYYIWFLFVIVTVVYFFFTSKKEYYQITAFLFIGMSICLFIYTVWPNGQLLRPDLEALGRDNFAIRIVSKLYQSDTNTNVCPSIHAFNSIACCIAIFRCDRLKKKKLLRISTFVLSVLICLATVFLKQHSVFDVLCAIVLSVIMYVFVYIPDYSRIYVKWKAKAKIHTSEKVTNN